MQREREYAAVRIQLAYKWHVYRQFMDTLETYNRRGPHSTRKFPFTVERYKTWIASEGRSQLSAYFQALSRFILLIRCELKRRKLDSCLSRVDLHHIESLSTKRFDWSKNMVMFEHMYLMSLFPAFVFPAYSIDKKKHVAAVLTESEVDVELHSARCMLKLEHFNQHILIKSKQSSSRNRFFFDSEISKLKIMEANNIGENYRNTDTLTALFSFSAEFTAFCNSVEEWSNDVMVPRLRLLQSQLYTMTVMRSRNMEYFSIRTSDFLSNRMSILYKRYVDGITRFMDITSDYEHDIVYTNDAIMNLKKYMLSVKNDPDDIHSLIPAEMLQTFSSELSRPLCSPKMLPVDDNDFLVHELSLNHRYCIPLRHGVFDGKNVMVQRDFAISQLYIHVVVELKHACDHYAAMKTDDECYVAIDEDGRLTPMSEDDIDEDKSVAVVPDFSTNVRVITADGATSNTQNVPIHKPIIGISSPITGVKSGAHPDSGIHYHRYALLLSHRILLQIQEDLQYLMSKKGISVNGSSLLLPSHVSILRNDMLSIITTSHATVEVEDGGEFDDDDDLEKQQPLSYPLWDAKVILDSVRQGIIYRVTNSQEFATSFATKVDHVFIQLLDMRRGLIFVNNEGETRNLFQPEWNWRTTLKPMFISLFSELCDENSSVINGTEFVPKHLGQLKVFVSVIFNLYHAIQSTYTIMRTNALKCSMIGLTLGARSFEWRRFKDNFPLLVTGASESESMQNQYSLPLLALWIHRSVLNMMLGHVNLCHTGKQCDIVKYPGQTVLIDTDEQYTWNYILDMFKRLDCYVDVSGNGNGCPVSFFSATCISFLKELISVPANQDDLLFESHTVVDSSSRLSIFGNVIKKMIILLFLQDPSSLLTSIKYDATTGKRKSAVDVSHMERIIKQRRKMFGQSSMFQHDFTHNPSIDDLIFNGVTDVQHMSASSGPCVCAPPVDIIPTDIPNYFQEITKSVFPETLQLDSEHIQSFLFFNHAVAIYMTFMDGPDMDVFFQSRYGGLKSKHGNLILSFFESFFFNPMRQNFSPQQLVHHLQRPPKHIMSSFAAAGVDYNSFMIPSDKVFFCTKLAISCRETNPSYQTFKKIHLMQYWTLALDGKVSKYPPPSMLTPSCFAGNTTTSSVVRVTVSKFLNDKIPVMERIISNTIDVYSGLYADFITSEARNLLHLIQTRDSSVGH